MCCEPVAIALPTRTGPFIQISRPGQKTSPRRNPAFLYSDYGDDRVRVIDSPKSYGTWNVVMTRAKGKRQVPSLGNDMLPVGECVPTPVHPSKPCHQSSHAVMSPRVLPHPHPSPTPLYHPQSNPSPVQSRCCSPKIHGATRSNPLPTPHLAPTPTPPHAMRSPQPGADTRAGSTAPKPSISSAQISPKDVCFPLPSKAFATRGRRGRDT